MNTGVTKTIKSSFNILIEKSLIKGLIEILREILVKWRIFFLNYKIRIRKID